MQIKTVGIHLLQLSDELKCAGYRRPDSAQLQETRDLGILNPVIVCQIPDSNKYEILASEETWFAAQQLGIHDVPVNIVCPESVSQKLQYVKVDSPEDPIAKAHRFRLWLDSEPASNKTTLAAIEGCTRSSVSHQIRLLSLENSIQKLLMENHISTAHGKELLKKPKGQGRVDAAQLAARGRWSVSRLKKHLSTKPKKRDLIKSVEAEPEKDINTIQLEKDLSGLVGNAVTIDLNSGELKIDFHNNYEILNGIIQKLGYRQ